MVQAAFADHQGALKTTWEADKPPSPPLPPRALGPRKQFSLARCAVGGGGICIHHERRPIIRRFEHAPGFHLIAHISPQVNNVRFTFALFALFALS
jgi:hypothetical protein